MIESIILDLNIPKLTFSGSFSGNTNYHIKLDEGDIKSDILTIVRPLGIATGTSWPWSISIYNSNLLNGHTLNELSSFCENLIHFEIKYDGADPPLFMPNSFKLTCQNAHSDPLACPTLNIIIDSISDCDTNSERHIIAYADVQENFQGNYQWFINNTAQSDTHAGRNVKQDTHTFNPSRQHASFRPGPLRIACTWHQKNVNSIRSVSLLNTNSSPRSLPLRSLLLIVAGECVRANYDLYIICNKYQ